MGLYDRKIFFKDRRPFFKAFMVTLTAVVAAAGLILLATVVMSDMTLSDIWAAYNQHIENS